MCKWGVEQPTVCLFSNDLKVKLEALKVALASQDVPWYVSEAYPPTVVHASQCHTNGKCVDVAIDTSKIFFFAPFSSLQGKICDNVTELTTAAATLGFMVGNEYLACGGTEYESTVGGHVHLEIP